MQTGTKATDFSTADENWGKGLFLPRMGYHGYSRLVQTLIPWAPRPQRNTREKSLLPRMAWIPRIFKTGTNTDSLGIATAEEHPEKGLLPRMSRIARIFKSSRKRSTSGAEGPAPYIRVHPRYPRLKLVGCFFGLRMLPIIGSAVKTGKNTHYHVDGQQLNVRKAR